MKIKNFDNICFFVLGILLTVIVYNSVELSKPTRIEEYDRGFGDGKYYCELMNARTGCKK